MKLKLNNPFHCPEGKWRGTCEAIEEPKKLMKRACSKQVRIRFSVDTDEGEKMVGKTFCAELSPGSELYEFLDAWLDGDLERLLDDNGEIDLDLLIGEQADLHIVHGPHGAEYRYPVVNIAGIYPVGRLTQR